LTRCWSYAGTAWRLRNNGDLAKIGSRMSRILPGNAGKAKSASHGGITRQMTPTGFRSLAWAEQVKKVNPDLVARDEKGQVYTVRYEAVTRCCVTSSSKRTASYRSRNPQSAA
jgi:hypothetical protein